MLIQYVPRQRPIVTSQLLLNAPVLYFAESALRDILAAELGVSASFH